MARGRSGFALIVVAMLGLLFSGQARTMVKCSNGMQECFLPMYALASGNANSNGSYNPGSFLKKLCPLALETSTCLNGLGSVCNVSELLSNMPDFVMIQEICTNTTGPGVCLKAISCFGPFFESSANTTCSVFPDMVRCVKTTVEKTGCSADQHPFSFDHLHTLFSSMCQDLTVHAGARYDCDSLLNCTSQQYGHVKHGVSGEAAMAATYLTMMEPRKLCRYVEKVMSCYVSEAATCRNSPKIVADMQIQQQKLKRECAKTMGPTGGSGKISTADNMVAWILGTVLAWILL